MLWLERPPILRWAGALLLVLVAAWSEFAPPPATTMAFLSTDVTAGTLLTDDLIERRRVTSPGFTTVDPQGVAVTDLKAGDPLVASMIAKTTIPDGWLLIAAPLPHHARPGMPATGVILPEDDVGEPAQFPAFVVESSSTDPFGEATGTLAVPEQWLGRAAAAAGSGRLVVGVEASAR